MPPISSTKPISFALEAIQTLPPAILFISSYDLDLESATKLTNRSYASEPHAAKILSKSLLIFLVGSQPPCLEVTTPSKFTPM